MDQGISVFVSFAPSDAALKEALTSHLAALYRTASFKSWSVDNVVPGDDRSAALSAALDSADVILILLSARFMTSKEYSEVRSYFQSSRPSSARVIPVVLRSCAWKSDPWLGALSPLPRTGRPIAGYTGDGRDRVLTEIVEEIAKIAGVQASCLPRLPQFRTSQNFDPSSVSHEPTPRLESTSIADLVFTADDDDPEPVDPLVAAMTPEGLEAHVAEFQKILDARAGDRSVHHFLATHTHFFNYDLRLFASCPLYHNVPLGADLMADFAWVDLGSFGPEWLFAKVEPADIPMFSPSGEPSDALNRAVQQVRDWHNWIAEDVARARRQFPHITYPMCFIFIGRYEDVTPEAYKRLRRLRYDLRAHAYIHTLDRFVRNALSVHGLLREPKLHHWQVPMHALTGEDLCARRPAALWRYLESDAHEEWLRAHHTMRMNHHEYAATLDVE